MTTFLLIDHNNTQCNAANFKAATAAAKLGQEIEAIIFGENIASVAQEASTIGGVSKVHTIDAAILAHQPAESIAPVLAGLLKSGDALVAASSTTTRNILPRVAALCDVMQISDIVEVIDEKTFVRPIYAGNAMQTLQTNDAIKVVTVRTTAFAAAPVQDACSVEPLQYEVATDAPINKFVGEELSKSDRPELTSAGIVISGGRGMQNGENFAMLENVADKLGAAIGASRAAVDAGYVPNDYQVGQTGKVVAPELYIAVGISGAIQHLAGMKDSKVIVAINKDEEAPIFQVADYGLVADLFQAVPELESKL